MFHHVELIFKTFHLYCPNLEMLGNMSLVSNFTIVELRNYIILVDKFGVPCGLGPILDCITTIFIIHSRQI
jgi:hypothetical protein